MISIDILRQVESNKQKLRIKNHKRVITQSYDLLTSAFFDLFSVEVKIITNPNNGGRSVIRTDNQPLTSEQKLFIDTFLKGFKSAVDILGNVLLPTNMENTNATLR